MTAPGIGGSIHIVAPSVTVTPCGFIVTADGSSAFGVYATVPPTVASPAAVIDAYAVSGPATGSINIATGVFALEEGGLVRTGKGGPGLSVTESTLSGNYPVGSTGSSQFTIGVDPFCTSCAGSTSITWEANGFLVVTTHPGPNNPVTHTFGPFPPGAANPMDPVRASSGGNAGAISITGATSIDVQGLVSSGAGGDAGSLKLSSPLTAVVTGNAGQGGMVSLVAPVITEGSSCSILTGHGGSGTNVGLSLTSLAPVTLQGVPAGAPAGDSSLTAPVALTLNGALEVGKGGDGLGAEVEEVP